MEKELIYEEIKKLSLKQPINRWWSWLAFTVGGTLGVVFFILFGVGDDKSHVLLAFGIIFIFVGVLLGIGFGLVYRHVANENIKKVLPVWEK